MFARHALDNTLFRRREGFDLTDNAYLTVLQRRALVLDGMDSTAFLDSPDIPAAFWQPIRSAACIRSACAIRRFWPTSG